MKERRDESPIQLEKNISKEGSWERGKGLEERGREQPNWDLLGRGEGGLCEHQALRVTSKRTFGRES